MFPVGEMSKDAVREVAQRRGLSVADKPDSQEICFVPDGDYAAVVDRRLPADRSGLIVDLAGRVVGRHEGVHHFTIGQRKGLGIAAADPLYVVRLDADRRLVTVGPRAAVETTPLHGLGVNWISGAAAGTQPCASRRRSGTGTRPRPPASNRSAAAASR